MTVEAFYDKGSKDYDRLRRGRYFVFLNRTEAEIVKKYCHGKDVLEVGCGTGLIMQELQGSVSNIVGIDLSTEMVRRSLEKGLQVSKADATALPFEDNAFDVVYSLKALPHVRDIAKALREACRVVKEEGWVIFEVYNAYSVKRLTDLLSGRYRGVPTSYYTFSKIKSILPEDLSVEETRGIRIITPVASLLSVPVISRFIITIEHSLSKTFLKFLGSYFVVVCKKRHGGG